MREYELINHLCGNILQLLDIQYPIIGGGMTIISDYHFASAITKAGGLGIVATGAMNQTDLFTELGKGNDNIGLNIISIHKEIDNIINDIQNIKIVFISGVKIKKEWIDILHKKGILCAAFASSKKIALHFQEIGIDMLVAEGCEAGGHIGEVTTSVLMQEIIGNDIHIPVIAAGGIGTGKCILGYLMMGANACQIGTRFACAKESIAHDKFKDKVISARSRDTFVSRALYEGFSVIPVRIIKNRACQEFNNYQKEIKSLLDQGILSYSEAQMQIEMFWVGSLRNAIIDGNIDEGSVMAGQIAGIITDKTQNIKNIIDEMMNDIYDKIRSINIMKIS